MYEYKMITDVVNINAKEINEPNKVDFHTFISGLLAQRLEQLCTNITFVSGGYEVVSHNVIQLKSRLVVSFVIRRPLQKKS